MNIRVVDDVQIRLIQNLIVPFLFQVVFDFVFIEQVFLFLPYRAIIQAIYSDLLLCFDIHHLSILVDLVFQVDQTNELVQLILVKAGRKSPTVFDLPHQAESIQVLYYLLVGITDVSHLFLSLAGLAAAGWHAAQRNS